MIEECRVPYRIAGFQRIYAHEINDSVIKNITNALIGCINPRGIDEELIASKNIRSSHSQTKTDFEVKIPDFAEIINLPQVFNEEGTYIPEEYQHQIKDQITIIPPAILPSSLND